MSHKSQLFTQAEETELNHFFYTRLVHASVREKCIAGSKLLTAGISDADADGVAEFANIFPGRKSALLEIRDVMPLTLILSVLSSKTRSAFHFSLLARLGQPNVVFHCACSSPQMAHRLFGRGRRWPAGFLDADALGLQAF